MTNDIDIDSWVSRCVAHMLMLDPQLDPELARPLADDLFSRDRWRTMGPEVAAQAVFDVGSRWGSDDV